MNGGSGKNHHLGAEHEAGAEADLEGEPSREFRVLLEQPVGRERDRRPLPANAPLGE
mgnify:CR=1 FL=1